MPRSIADHVEGASTRVVEDELDRFPPLVVYRCLSDGVEELVRSTRTHLDTDQPSVSEILTLPRRGLGPRPVEVLSATTRALYGATVASLAPAMPEPSRREGNWAVHREFGSEGDHEHVVELDFASCYEFIDHVDLQRELLLRSFEADTVRALGKQLAGLGRRGRGLPQMLEASDLLADTYLSVIDRRLMRSGYELHRYADDVRVLAHDWNQANRVVEEAADHARELGLVLSSAKTSIRLRETLKQDEQVALELLKTHFDGAKSDLTQIELFPGKYGEPIAIETDPGAVPALIEAYRRVLGEWHVEQQESRIEKRPMRLPRGLESHIGPALTLFAAQGEDIEPKLLVDLVFQDATKLENVCMYLRDRIRASGANHENVVAPLESLMAMGRQSPWAKLWLLHLADELRELTPAMTEWLEAQFEDGHETVRAQAAWVASGYGLLTTAALQACYGHATDLSAPAMAAAACRQDRVAAAIGADQLNRATVQAIRDDHPLNREAWQWADPS